MWKYSNVCSKGVLIDRGLDLYSICYCDFSFSNAVFRVAVITNYELATTVFPGVYGAVEPH